MLIPKIGEKYERSKTPDWLTTLSDIGYIKFKEYRIAYCEGRNSLNIGDRLSGCGAKIAFPNQSTENFISCTQCDNDYSFEELIEGSTFIKELIYVDYDMIVNKIIEKIKESNCEIISIEGTNNRYILRVMDREYLLIFDCKHSDGTVKNFV